MKWPKSLAAAAAAAMLALSGACQATLVRQANALEVLDTQTNLLWLYNWSSSPRGNWNDARNWAAGLTVGGAAAGEWRLPEMDEYLDLEIQLGFSFGNLLSHFINVQTNPGFYWLGTEFAPDPSKAWYFQISLSLNVPNVIDKDFGFLQAVAVRAGPVTTAVPEPQTLTLVLLALAATMAVCKRRQR